MAVGDLTDLDSVKAWLSGGVGSGQGGIGTTNDALIGSLITSVSAFINQYLNRTLLSASYVELYQGNGQSFMPLRQAPVTAVSAVQWSGQTLNAGNPLTLTSGYYIDGDGRTLRVIGYGFPFRVPVQVSYTAGYLTPPADIAQACNELVGEAYKRRDRIGQVSKTLGGQEVVSYSVKDMNDTTRAMLAPYKVLAPF